MPRLQLYYFPRFGGPRLVVPIRLAWNNFLGANSSLEVKVTLSLRVQDKVSTDFKDKQGVLETRLGSLFIWKEFHVPGVS